MASCAGPRTRTWMSHFAHQRPPFRSGRAALPRVNLNILFIFPPGHLLVRALSACPNWGLHLRLPEGVYTRAEGSFNRQLEPTRGGEDHAEDRRVLASQP